MKEKNVLLITFYWPPSGGAGVHRWLRFSKYFKENGVNLTVYCPEDAAWPAIDKNLEKEVSKDITVLKTKIFEPHKYIAKAKKTGVGFTQEKKQSILSKMIVWTRGNLFIPDARKFWIKPSIKYLSRYLIEHPEIDTVISTGPPHSMHLIALGLKKKFNIKWIADFRDPWTQIDFYQDLLPGKRADQKHKQLEKECLTKADEVITVSRSCGTGLEEIGHRKVHVITNGFDFPEFDSKSIHLDDKFSIAHFGSMPFARNPLILWKALKNLLKQNSELKSKLQINLIGTVDYQVLASAEAFGLKDYISIIPPIPHRESIQLQRSTQLLLLVANNTGNVKGILTGKFFEYLGAKRPIVAIGESESDLEDVVNDTNCGFFSSYENEQGLESYILKSFEKYQSNSLQNEAKNTQQFNSSNLVKKVIDLI